MPSLKTDKKKKKYSMGGIFIIGSLSFLYTSVATLQAHLLEQTSPPLIQIQRAEPLSSNTELSSGASVVHIKTPAAVKAIFMSSCTVATPSARDRVVGIVNNTEINSLIIDVKDLSGMISYDPIDETLRQPSATSTSCKIGNIRPFIAGLHKNNIYVIGRIAVFQDESFSKIHPNLAVQSKETGGIWRDYKGLEWIDPSSREMWDYTIALARDAYAEGFDEINFDYVRFPADGKLSDMEFPISGEKEKAEVMKNFFEYVNSRMKTSGITTSADIFGLTTTSADDLNIGQVLENTLPYFDYVAPMVYPSQFPAGFNNWSNPSAHPYDLIKFVMNTAVLRTLAASTTPLKLRPWLQDFSLGMPPYGKKQVADQIRATYDAGLTSWMLWDPSNKYSGGALLPE